VIRDFHVDDTSQVIAMMRELHQESPYHARLDFDPVILGLNLARPDVKGWVGVGRDGGFRGYCFAACVPSLFGADTTFTDISLFVRKPYRNGILALGLVRRMEAWGRAMGARLFQHGVSTGNPAAGAIYTRLGYELVGGVYCKSA
jgi:GNAT superfamily N-acetyltransferase